MIPRTTASNRDWNNPKDKAWRLNVFRRDRFKCRRCGGKRQLQAHHIRTWSDAPELRLIVVNGITLCKKCHQLMWGNEDKWESACRALMNKSGYLQMKCKLYSIESIEKEEDNEIQSDTGQPGTDE